MSTLNSITNKFITVLLATCMLALALGVQAVPPAYASSATWYVATSGDDSADCAIPATPCLTINGALGKAAAGDSIEVAVGTYTGSGIEVVMINKAITLSGGWDAGFTTQSGLSTVDGEAVRRGITNISNPVVIDHFQVQHGFHNYQGGGIATHGVLTINNSIINNNYSDVTGGGIDLGGTLTINNSTITANIIGNGGYGSGGGGGIENDGGTLTINSSTISDNTAIGHFQGSGIYSTGSTILNNTTMSGNKMMRNGSTIIGTIDAPGIYTTIYNSTISGNQNGLGAGNFTIQNSILAGNTPGGKDFDCQKITSAGHNIIGNKAGCTFTPASGDQVGTLNRPINPRLGPLQNNGGPTFTRALLSGSPALDTGSPAAPGSGGNACLATDQRGITRPLQSACDIGAYEVDVPFSIPATLAPAAAITDTTPTYHWNTILGAILYQYVMVKGTKIIYSKTIPASACSALACSNTPKTPLGLGNTYKWKIRAMVGGIWQSYSPYQAFQITPARVGLWESPGLEFYVPPSGDTVDNFAIYVRACGLIYRVIHGPLAAIHYIGQSFVFRGTFYATGVFTTPTSAAGTLGLSGYYLRNCGYASGGPFPWTAIWKNANQPAGLNPADTTLFADGTQDTGPFTIEINPAKP